LANAIVRGDDGGAKQIQSPNILVLGEERGGKTSLIEAVFRLDLKIPASALGSVTPTFQEYKPSSGVPLTVIDSAAYKMGEEPEGFVKSTYQFLDERAAAGPDKQVHLTWYVVPAESGRLRDYDLDLL